MNQNYHRIKYDPKEMTVERQKAMAAGISKLLNAYDDPASALLTLLYSAGAMAARVDGLNEATFIENAREAFLVGHTAKDRMGDMLGLTRQELAAIIDATLTDALSFFVVTPITDET